MTEDSSRRHDERFDDRNVKHLSLLSFIFGFVDALYVYILSTYFADVIGSDNVGGFYLATFAVVLVLLWNLHRLLRRIGGSVRVYFLLLVCAVAMSATMSVIEQGWIGAVILSSLLVVINLAWVTLDVIIEENSSDSVTGTVRGLHLTVMNAGFMLGPFISTSMLGTYGYGGVFFLVTLGFAVLLALSIIMIRPGTGYSSAQINPRSTWKKMLREPNLFHIYAASLALEIFYAVMIIYTPIYLRSQGLSWDEVGILFTVMLIPFVILQYPLGVLADRKFGEKEFLIASLFIAAVATTFIGLYGGGSIFLWGAALFMTRVGAAGMEVLRDAYFYKQIDAADDDLIGFFRTARPMANIGVAIIALPFLVAFPLQWLFLLLAAILALAIICVAHLEDTPAQAERQPA